MVGKIQSIYERMGDDLSRKIYIDRINYSITKDWHYLEALVDRTVRNRTEWKLFCDCLKEKAKNFRMYLFGAGVWGNILYKETRSWIQWQGVVDSWPAGKVIYALTEGAIYFDLEELKPLEANEVFVDAGGFDGCTTREFFKWCKGNGHSYCFEADKRNILSIKSNLTETDCDVISKALWSESTFLSMDMKGNYASSIMKKGKVMMTGW